MIRLGLMLGLMLGGWNRGFTRMPVLSEWNHGFTRIDTDCSQHVKAPLTQDSGERSFGL